MIFVTLACAGLTAWTALIERPQRLQQRQWAAVKAVCAKGVSLHWSKVNNTYTVFFEKSNLVEDLEKFLPAFTTPGGWIVGSGLVRSVDFNGSHVSAENIKRFQDASGIEIEYNDRD
jgi:hypothetical protein